MNAQGSALAALGHRNLLLLIMVGLSCFAANSGGEPVKEAPCADQGEAGGSSS